MTVYIVTGGTIDRDFLAAALRKQEGDKIIAAEGGAEACLGIGIHPDLIVGDFDTAGEGLLKTAALFRIPCEKHPAEKDETDTELALMRAAELCPDRIRIFGATGTRLDHVHANLSMLARLAQGEETCGIDAAIIDPHNFIRIVRRGMILRKNPARKEFVSLSAWSDTVSGLTLTGFKYPLTDYTMHRNDTIGTSNEIKEETAEIRFRDGLLLVIRSAD